MAQALRDSVLKRTTYPGSFRSTDDSLDSIPTIVGWTLLTVVGFWTPVALVAYIATSRFLG